MFLITNTVANALASKIRNAVMQKTKQDCVDLKKTIAQSEDYTRMVALRTQAEENVKQANLLQRQIEQSNEVGPFDVKIQTDNELIVTKRTFLFGIKEDIIIKNHVEGKSLDAIESELFKKYTAE